MLHKENTFLLILGCGYVGSAYLKHFPSAQATIGRAAFELSRPESWKTTFNHFPSNGKVLWTFPAASTSEEEQLALDLYDTFLKDKKVIIYGTASSYFVKNEGEIIKEDAILDFENPRTRTEEKLRKKGACILHLSGIFGPNRDPLSWYEKNRIQAGLSYLNLIHLKDILFFTQKLFESSPISGERFNLSNGEFKTHHQIVEELKSLKKLPSDYFLPFLSKPGNKRVSNEKIKKFLSLENYPFIKFPSFI